MTGRALRAGLYGFATEPMGTSSQPFRVTIPSRGPGSAPRQALPACRSANQKRARHSHARGGYRLGKQYRRPAAERLRLLVWWPGPPRGARRAAFLLGGEESPFPKLFRFPLEVCPSPHPVARGVHKAARGFTKLPRTLVCGLVPPSAGRKTQGNGDSKGASRPIKTKLRRALNLGAR